MKKTLLILVGSVCALVSSGYAATLTGSVDIDPATSANLTTDGTLDWAIWNTTDGTGVSSIAATNVKSGGPDLFSDITRFGGATTVRGVSNATETYTYTDGVSPTSITNVVQGFVINSTLATAGSGVQLSITGDASQLFHVEIWGVGFAGRGTMTATLANATTVSLDSEIYSFDGANKVANLFSFDFTPDSNSDLLNISFALKDNIGFNGHVGFQAITVSAVTVPEPATYALLLGGIGLAVVMIQRRRRA